MISVQLKVEFVARRQMLPSDADTTSVDDEQKYEDVDQVRRPCRRFTPPHFHLDSARDSFKLH